MSEEKEQRLFEHLEEMVTMDVYNNGEYISITTYYEGNTNDICLSYSEAETLRKALNYIFGDDDEK